MSYNSHNIAGRCPPGIACPTPMALPSYSSIKSPKIPMPIYQQQIMPQQQFGIVGGPSHFAPPPAVSYAPHYVCYNAGHQSYNNTLGTLSNIIIGAIYSSPMGGSAPGQLATQGGANPYAAYMPPGQDPNQYYQEQCVTNPPSYHPQPYPMPPVVGGGSCGSAGHDVKSCDPCKPRGPKAYDEMFAKIGHKPEVKNAEKKDKIVSDQWEGDVSGGKGTIKINDRYTIKLDESNSQFVIYDKCEGSTTKIWGDPHLNTEANGNLIFKDKMSFVLEDGTKITVKTVPFKGGDGTQTLSSELYITNGDKSMKVTGLASEKSTVDKKGDGDLKIVVSETNGKVLDKMIDDGAITVYQVGDVWVNGANGKELTQNQIDVAEAAYDDEEDKEAYEGSKKDDKITGTSKDDRYIATEGDDVFDGGAGKDTAVFEGNLEDYEVVRRSDGRIVVTDEYGNETTLKGVEFIEFNGKSYRVSDAGNENNEADLGKKIEERVLVFGKAGNDTYTVEEHAKTVYFDGGAGEDKIVLSGKKDDYKFDEGEGGAVIITDDSGKVVAVINDVEKISFGGETAELVKDLI